MYQRILVPVDGSATSDLALDAAVRLARESGGRVRLVHVLADTAWMYGYDMYGGATAGLHETVRKTAEDLLRQGMDRARAAGIEADLMLFDEPGQRLGEVVARAAKLWNADLVAVGTHGRRGFSRLLMGSGAQEVIALAPVPVLVVREPDAGR